MASPPSFAWVVSTQNWHDIWAIAVVAAFLLTEWPRELVPLTAAGVLLVSRRSPPATSSANIIVVDQAARLGIEID
jgi:hypothetical protein